MGKVYKSKVAKWYLWFCIGMTIAFLGSIFLCYKSTWVLLIDVVFMGIALFMIYDMLLHTDYTIRGERLHIRCGFLFRMNLPISQISEITHKSTILSSPGLYFSKESRGSHINITFNQSRNTTQLSPSNQSNPFTGLCDLAKQGNFITTLNIMDKSFVYKRNFYYICQKFCL